MVSSCCLYLPASILPYFSRNNLFPLHGSEKKHMLLYQRTTICKRSNDCPVSSHFLQCSLDLPAYSVFAACPDCMKPTDRSRTCVRDVDSFAQKSFCTWLRLWPAEAAASMPQGQSPKERAVLQILEFEGRKGKCGLIE